MRPAAISPSSSVFLPQVEQSEPWHDRPGYLHEHHYPQLLTVKLVWVSSQLYRADPVPRAKLEQLICPLPLLRWQDQGRAVGVHRCLGQSHPESQKRPRDRSHWIPSYRAKTASYCWVVDGWDSEPPDLLSYGLWETSGPLFLDCKLRQVWRYGSFQTLMCQVRQAVQSWQKPVFDSPTLILCAQVRS